MGRTRRWRKTALRGVSIVAWHSVKTEIQVNVMSSHETGLLSCIRQGSGAEVVWKSSPILEVYDFCMTFCATFLTDTWQKPSFVTGHDVHLTSVFTERYSARLGSRGILCKAFQFLHVRQISGNRLGEMLVLFYRLSAGFSWKTPSAVFK